MPIVTQPHPLPSPLDYVPPNSVAHPVTTGETWWTLADLPQVQHSGMTANDLCYFNFKTRKPAEINWYLHHKVGCTRTTRDGKNYVFSTSDSPGIVYLPVASPPKPVDEFPPVPLDTRVWVGLALKTTNPNGEQISAFAISIDNPDRWMMITGNVFRQGVAFGPGTGGLGVMLITGVKRPSQLNNHTQGEMDFSLDVGGKAGSAIKGATSAKKYAPLVKFIRTIGAKTPAGFREALMKDPENVAKLVKLLKSNKEAWGLEHDKPNVMLIDTPVGLGAEVGLFYSTVRYQAVGFGDD